MVTMTASRVGMELMTEPAFDQLNALGDRVRESLSRAMRNSGYPGQITVFGSIFKIHTHDRPASQYRSAWSMTAENAISTRSSAACSGGVSRSAPRAMTPVDRDDGGGVRLLRRRDPGRTLYARSRPPQRRVIL